MPVIERTHPWQHRATCQCEWCSAEAQTPTDADDEPDFTPPRIDCCDSAVATGGAYHRPGCPNAS